MGLYSDSTRTRNPRDWLTATHLWNPMTDCGLCRVRRIREWEREGERERERGSASPGVQQASTRTLNPSDWLTASISSKMSP